MLEFAVLILGPLLINLVLIAVIATAKSRGRLYAVAIFYSAINVFGVLIYGAFFVFEKARTDWIELVSLILFVLLMRRIDLYGFKGLLLFREARKRLPQSGGAN